MKNYLLGVATVVLLGFGFQLAWFQGLNDENEKMSKIGYKGGEVLRLTYLVIPVTGRCTTPKMVEYFECDGVQVEISNLIYGPQED